VDRQDDNGLFAPALHGFMRTMVISAMIFRIFAQFKSGLGIWGATAARDQLDNGTNFDLNQAFLEVRRSVVADDSLVSRGRQNWPTAHHA